MSCAIGPFMTPRLVHRARAVDAFESVANALEIIRAETGHPRTKKVPARRDIYRDARDIYRDDDDDGDGDDGDDAG